MIYDCRPLTASSSRLRQSSCGEHKARAKNFQTRSALEIIVTPLEFEPSTTAVGAISTIDDVDYMEDGR
eukprot:scaffold6613_cov158-Skeletonema_marinoi.AAC.5